MSSIKRAVLYISRKKFKSIIMLVFIWLISLFVLVSMSIRGATEAASKSLRESIGASFTIKGLAVATEGTNFTFSTIPQSVVNSVMEVGGILFYNAGSYMNFMGGNIAAMPGLDYEETSYKGTVSANHYTGANTYFSNNEFTIYEGKHIQFDDQYVAIINNELADYNALSLGDHISLDGQDGSTTVEIIGVFQLEEYTEPALATAELPQNLIFIDYFAYEELGGASNEYSSSVSFFVQDPALLDQIVESVKDTRVDPTQYTVSSDDAGYQRAATYLNEIKQFITILFVAVCVVSILILILIFLLQIRNRVNEAGIFISIGISKLSIIGQFLLEILIVSLVAFLLSYIAGTILSNKIHDYLLSGLPQAHSIELVFANGGELDSIIAGPALSIGKILLVYVAQVGVVCSTVLIASYSILRIKPKEILSKMS